MPLAYLAGNFTRSAPRGETLGKPQRLPHPQRLGLLQHRVAECDVAQAQPPVPEQNRLLVVLAPRLYTRHDLAQFRMQVVLVEFVSIDVTAQRTVGESFATLSPIVDNHLTHD